MKKTIINLSPSQNSIQGQFSNGDEVVVLCDATDGDFTVAMPDSFSSHDSTFRFVKEETSLNVIQLVPMTNQHIMGETSQELTESYDELVLSSDGKGGWV